MLSVLPPLSHLARPIFHGNLVDNLITALILFFTACVDLTRSHIFHAPIQGIAAGAAEATRACLTYLDISVLSPTCVFAHLAAARWRQLRVNETVLLQLLRDSYEYLLDASE